MKKSLKLYAVTMASMGLLFTACAKSGGGKASEPTVKPISGSPVTDRDGKKTPNILVDNSLAQVQIPADFLNIVQPTDLSSARKSVSPLNLLSGDLSQDKGALLLMAPYSSIRVRFNDGSTKDYFAFTESFQLIAMKDRDVAVVAASRLPGYSERHQFNSISNQESQVSIHDIPNTSEPNLNVSIDDIEDAETPVVSETYQVTNIEVNIAINVLNEVEEVHVAKEMNAPAPTTTEENGKKYAVWSWQDLDHLSDQELIELKCLCDQTVISDIIYRLSPEAIAKSRGAKAALKCFARKDAKNLIETIRSQKSSTETREILRSINSPFLFLALSNEDHSRAESYIKNIKLDSYNSHLDLILAIQLAKSPTDIMLLSSALVAYDYSVQKHVIYGLTEAMIKLYKHESKLSKLFEKVKARDKVYDLDVIYTTRKILENFVKRTDSQRDGLSEELSLEVVSILKNVFNRADYKRLEIVLVDAKK